MKEKAVEEKRFQFTMFSLVVPFCKRNGRGDVFREPKHIDPLELITPSLMESHKSK